jgi:AcrR family transcriptional regulator
MVEMQDSGGRKRNRNYEDTHEALIEKAVELISEKGADSLSVSALARATRINRSTVYYHFQSRDALVGAVRVWSSEQIARGVAPGIGQEERITRILEFVVGRPQVMKMWIDDFISPGDIRDRYQEWDALVTGIGATFAEHRPDEDFDAEVFATILLSAALIGPRVFAMSVAPGEDMARVVERFMREQRRLLDAYGLLTPSRAEH